MAKYTFTATPEGRFVVTYSDLLNGKSENLGTTIQEHPLADIIAWVVTEGRADPGDLIVFPWFIVQFHRKTGKA